MDRRTFLAPFRSSRQKESASHPSLLPGVPSLEPYVVPLSVSAIHHLLRRAVVAPTLEEVNEARSMSLEAIVNMLVAPVDTMPPVRGWLGDAVNSTGAGWYERFDLDAPFHAEMRRWWFNTMVNNGLSIRERMTLFWHNHFATNTLTMRDPRLMFYQNRLFRRHALGSFRDLVRDVTIDKAMLIFLDGRHSKRDGWVNENYARELQELFTIGIADNDGNPNYTQEDVVEAARALSGWDWITDGPIGDVMNNLLTGHDFTGKTVYGEAIEGRQEGLPELERLLDIIFAKEQTARYVIRKLYRFFVHTDTTLTPVRPIPADVEEHIIAPLAAEFRASNWNIATVLRRLLMSTHFFEADLVGAMVKSPVDLLVGTLRGMRSGALSGDRADYLFDLAQDRAVTLGQNLFFPPGVQGWQFHRSWISTTTLPQRHHYLDEMLNGVERTLTDRPYAAFPDTVTYRKGTARIDVLAFAAQFPSIDDPIALVRDIAAHLLGYPPSDSLLQRLLIELVGDRAYEWVATPDEIRTTRLRAMLRYLMRSTNYQLM